VTGRPALWDVGVDAVTTTASLMGIISALTTKVVRSAGPEWRPGLGAQAEWVLGHCQGQQLDLGQFPALARSTVTYGL
jgi:hypothetical protein